MFGFGGREKLAVHYRESDRELVAPLLMSWVTLFLVGGRAPVAWEDPMTDRARRVSLTWRRRRRRRRQRRPISRARNLNKIISQGAEIISLAPSARETRVRDKPETSPPKSNDRATCLRFESDAARFALATLESAGYADAEQ